MDDDLYPLKTQFDDDSEPIEPMQSCLLSFMSFCTAAFLLVVLLAVFGCKSPEYTIKTETDTLYISKVQRDTIYQSRLDSIYIKDSTVTETRNDTVFRDRWHTRIQMKTDTIYKWDWSVDTVYQTITVTTPPTEVEVEKQLSWWQQTRMIVGDIALLAILLTLAVHYLRKKVNL